MTDSVLTLVLLFSFIAVVALVRFFKTLDPDFWRAARTPFIAGLVAGVILRFADGAVATGLVLTAAALYVRLTGDESEPTDGMMVGSVMGAAAALPLLFGGGDELLHLAETILSGAVAGYGITFAAFHANDRLRQFLLDVVTAAAAVGAAFLPRLSAMPPRNAAYAVTAAVPLLVIVTVLAQWRDVRAELSHEAALGFIDETDVRRTAHPILRLGRGGWRDRHAHRQFVRIANRIALRKRQQRNRSEEVARLYQLEIIKLRMQLQEMNRIDLHARREAAGDELASDTMPPHA